MLANRTLNWAIDAATDQEKSYLKWVVSSAAKGKLGEKTVALPSFFDLCRSKAAVE